MGFGSYDESEQENQEVDVGEDEGSVDKGSDYEGEEEFEFGDADTDDLVEKLGDMREEDEE